MSYDPETRLILLCLSAKEDTEMVRLLHAISSQEIDWSYVLMFSQQGVFAPLLFHNLKRYGIAWSIPEEIRHTFEKIYHSVGFQNALYMEELRHLLHVFEKTGIKTVVLKGAAIAEDVFRNIALRQMADIDLLVQEEDLSMAEEKLSESGYIPYEYKQSKEWYRMNFHHLAPYYHPQRKIAIEIHRNIIPIGNPFGIDIRKLWGRAQPVNIGDVRTLVLSPEDLIIHLCLHFAYCGGFSGGLRCLIDISQVIKYHGDRIDWSWMAREANEHHYVNFIYYPLHLAKDLLNANIESDVLNTLNRCSKLNGIYISLLNLMTRNILLKDEASSILPKGYLTLFCKQLLDNTPIHRKIQYLIKRLFRKPAPEGTDSSMSSVSNQDNPSAAQRIRRIFSSNSRHLTRAVFRKRKVTRRQH